MRRPLRIALAAIGLCAAVYSTASLTGGWLGEPPWWTKAVASTPVTAFGKTSDLTLEQVRDGRELISGAVILAGLGLLAGAGWPRRSATSKAI